MYILGSFAKYSIHYWPCTISIKFNTNKTVISWRLGRFLLQQWPFSFCFVILMWDTWNRTYFPFCFRFRIVIGFLPIRFYRGPLLASARELQSKTKRASIWKHLMWYIFFTFALGMRSIFPIYISTTDGLPAAGYESDTEIELGCCIVHLR